MTRKAYKFEVTPLALGLAVAGLAPTASSAADVPVDLCVTDGSVVVDGATVPIWGYVLGTTCAAGAATLPNPVIRATA